MSKPFVGTYTALNTFKRICEYQAYRRYVVKDIPFEPTPATEWGTAVHEAMAARLASKQDLPETMKHWEGFAHPFDQYKIFTERKLGADINGEPTGYFSETVWFRGQADLVVLQEPRAYIIDWKTANSKYEDPFELQTNAWLLNLHFPKITQVVGSYAWLKENRMSQIYDCSDFTRTWMEIDGLMTAIAEKRQSGQFEKRKSGLCGWCPVEDCEYFYVSEKRK